MWIGFWQPHGFFNCSPTVDVPQNPACELESKYSEVKEVVASKPLQNGLLSKLWRRQDFAAVGDIAVVGCRLKDLFIGKYLLLSQNVQ